MLDVTQRVRVMITVLWRRLSNLPTKCRPEIERDDQAVSLRNVSLSGV